MKDFIIIEENVKMETLTSYKIKGIVKKVIYPLKVVGDCPMEKNGTTVTFKPDAKIFEETVYEFNTLKQRLREIAFLTKNLKIILRQIQHC